jgi:ABC-type amino acid transport system permease subunit
MVIKNQKAKAAVRTVAFVAVVAIASIILRLVLANLTEQQIFTGFMILLGGMALYTVYGLFLAQIEYDDKIREMGKKFSVDQK